MNRCHGSKVLLIKNYMVIETDRHSGFCFGVQNAVEIAEDALRNGEKVFSLGQIVHNDMEVERLSSLGLVSIHHDQFRNLKNCKVLIRAHGEPPETYRIAEENNIEIIEATCPIVRRLQSKIRQSWNKISEKGGQVVIFGKPGHAEVVGLQGQINNQGILVSSISEITKIDVTRPVYLFSQTTMSVSDFDELAGKLKSQMAEKGINDVANHLIINKTICGQVSNREPHLIAFAEKHDVIIFVSGRESSNGRMLYSICRSVNPDTHFISVPEEISAGWFTGKKSAGICGATSTPKWLIEMTREKIIELLGEK